MNTYRDETRGTFQYLDYAKQLVSFEGLLFEGQSGKMNVTPTDIDGYVELVNENSFFFFELKHSGGIPVGQAKAFSRLADRIEAGGGNCVIFVAVHNTRCSDMIIAKDAIVTQIYYHGRWRHATRECRLYEATKTFVKFFKEKAHCDREVAIQMSQQAGNSREYYTTAEGNRQ